MLRGVKYVSFNDDSGYAVAARGYMRALADCGTPVTWEALAPGSAHGLPRMPGTVKTDHALLHALQGKPIEYDRVIVHAFPEYFPMLFAQERRHLGPEGKIIGCTVWETDKPPAHWPPLLSCMDALIVPTHWNREVFARAGVRRPMHVVPHLSEFEGVQAPAADTDRLQAFLPSLENKFVFYTINTWLERKGVELTLRAYLDAFTADDNVILIVKTTPVALERKRRSWSRGFRKTDIEVQELVSARMRRKQRPPPVALLTQRLNANEMQALHAVGDCYVSLCRGEGWGLGAYEAAWAGNPVIMTGFGGQTEFLPKDLPTLVRWRPTPVIVPHPNRSYTPDQTWAEPDSGHAAALMRAAAASPTDAKKEGRRLQQFVEQRFNRSRITQALLHALE